MNDTRCAIVTGGSRGIGRATAIRLAQDGFDVGFCYHRDEVAAKQTAEAITELGRRVCYQAVDVADLAAVREFTERVERELGPVHTVVANAGITRDTPLAIMAEQDWQDVLRTNLDGTFTICRAVAFGMIRRRAGNIITVSSVAGISGNAGQTNYAAAKAGMIGFTASLAKEVGRYGIRANVVAPGFIESDMIAVLRDSVRDKAVADTALGHFGRPEDVADAVSFLASDRARYITATVLRVDGGLSI
ncbi:MAG TPA: 3-oxoacyl-[acyl-carrier-protein] reductase [Pseudonocardiaceae bacterium]|jgi:3-oxoacyl-[acyl-carrier protein] reductase